jgi:hypothetical protein
MSAFICAACGTQHAPSEAPPDTCPACTDERQFVPGSGQSWTTLERLRSTHSNKFRRLAPGLMTIETTPAFGIGQRAILARTPSGNVLWECIALVDDATVDLLNGLGGVQAIAISHPHYYTTMVEWSRALGGVPIYLHAADRQWVMRPDPRGAVLGWGHNADRARPHAGSAGRALCGWDRSALGRLGARSRRTALGRHPASGPERPRQLHVVLSEPYPALGRNSPAHGKNSGAIRVRRRVWFFFWPESDRRKR